jgi:hypothetical protein
MQTPITTVRSGPFGQRHGAPQSVPAELRWGKIRIRHSWFSPAVRHHQPSGTARQPCGEGLPAAARAHLPQAGLVRRGGHHRGLLPGSWSRRARSAAAAAWSSRRPMCSTSFITRRDRCPGGLARRSRRRRGRAARNRGHPLYVGQVTLHRLSEAHVPVQQVPDQRVLLNSLRLHLKETRVAHRFNTPSRIAASPARVRRSCAARTHRTSSTSYADRTSSVRVPTPPPSSTGDTSKIARSLISRARVPWGSLTVAESARHSRRTAWQSPTAVRPRTPHVRLAGPASTSARRRPLVLLVLDSGPPGRLATGLEAETNHTSDPHQQGGRETCVRLGAARLVCAPADSLRK